MHLEKYRGVKKNTHGGKDASSNTCKQRQSFSKMMRKPGDLVETKGAEISEGRGKRIGVN